MTRPIRLQRKRTKRGFGEHVNYRIIDRGPGILLMLWEGTGEISTHFVLSKKRVKKLIAELSDFVRAS